MAACSTCKYYHPNDANSGLCRRREPQIHFAQEALWPTCLASDWCGEWKASNDGSDIFGRLYGASW